MKKENEAPMWLREARLAWSEESAQSTCELGPYMDKALFALPRKPQWWSFAGSGAEVRYGGSIRSVLDKKLESR